MSSTDSPVVIRDKVELLPRGRGRKNNADMSKNSTNKYKEKVIDYSQDLQSRFGRAFLPFATQLESVEKEKTWRKRKGKNKRKQPVKLTKLPSYKNNDKKKGGLYDSQCRQNNDRINKKGRHWNKQLK